MVSRFAFIVTSKRNGKLKVYFFRLKKMRKRSVICGSMNKYLLKVMLGQDSYSGKNKCLTYIFLTFAKQLSNLKMI